MKKNYLILAAVAGLLASCTQNEEIVKISEKDSPIQFEEFINKSTRAEIKDEQALANAGGFWVWGYKAKTTGLNWATSEKTTIFTKQKVTGTDATNPTWSYTPLKYWDKTSTYKFFAGGPVNFTGGGTLAWADDVFTVTGAVSSKAANSQSDFVIDRIANVENGTRTVGTPVNLEFHHIMAKLMFKVQRTVESEIKITSLTMTGWNADTGNFTQTKFDGTWSEINNSEWSFTTSSNVAGNVTLIGSGAGDESITLNSNDAVELKDMYIMVPQDIAANALTFTLTYTLDGETFSDQVGKLTTAQKWGTDTSNSYTIKIGPDAITFDVTKVCDFCVTGNTSGITVQ